MAITSVAPVIDDTGISAPSLLDILDYLQNQYKQIFGADIYLGSDSQDGQFLAILADAINDTNSACIAIYNGFSPATASGAGLSNVIKINGLTRQQSTSSTVDLTLTGVAGTTINNGIVQDNAGYRWDLPAISTIGSSGSSVVTATCETPGAITASANTVTQIVTPIRGWQAVTNDTDATVGKDVESDGTVRQRQAISTELPSVTIMEGILGSIANISGVTRYRGYENSTGTADSNGIPAHAIAFVVDGGDATQIAQTIADKKTPGTPTDGTTTIAVTDSAGVSNNINFYRPTPITIQATITITALSGYLSTTGDDIKQAVADYINGLGIGQTLYLSRLYVPANLAGQSVSSTFEIESITLGSNGGTQSAQNITVPFNDVASCVTSDVTVTVNAS